MKNENISTIEKSPLKRTRRVKVIVDSVTSSSLSIDRQKLANNFSHFLYCKAENRTTVLSLCNGTFIKAKINFGTFVSELPPDIFAHIHKSWSVNIHFIDRILESGSRRPFVLMKNGEMIPCATRRKRELMDILSESILCSRAYNQNEVNDPENKYFRKSG
jgi:DNA-binding LytR/AlgR family response regulator